MRRLTVLLPLLTALVFAGPHAGAAADPYRPQQWGLDHIEAPAAWASGRGANTTIAIVDSGVDLNHPDLKSRLVAGTDFYDGDGDARDEHGHGTHVAGIAAASADNGIGIAGVAPEARIMPLRVLGPDGSGSAGDVNAAIRYAADRGATVINLSLSGDVVLRNVGVAGGIESAINYAWSKGTISVIAAGNDALFPSGYDNVKAIVVVATDHRQDWANYSNSSGGGLLRNPDWAISAPGGSGDGTAAHDILSTYWDRQKGSTYGSMHGTSMAAPFVAGAAAILRGLGLSPQATVDRLLGTAKDLGEPGIDSTYGAGLLQAGRATAGLRRSSAGGGGGPAATGAPGGATGSGGGRASRSGARASAAAPSPAVAGETAELSGTPEATPAGVPLARPAPEAQTDASPLRQLVVFTALVLAGTGAALVWRRLRTRA